MQLRTIKLIGFKSFVDPTVIHIEGDMTAIVGPNGCGKSNVVDAIRWVIGETSAKQLRGQSMSDVIFNGTTSRKPVGKAAVELIFDQAIGDIFSVRLAGNIASEDAIGSLEFGIKYLKSKLLVVLGHTSCGAVKACCDNFKDAHITQVVSSITPCLYQEKTFSSDRTSANSDFVQKISDLNVKHQIEYILSKSDIINNLYKNNEISIIGAMYDIQSGEVKFFES